MQDFQFDTCGCSVHLLLVSPFPPSQHRSSLLSQIIRIGESFSKMVADCLFCFHKPSRFYRLNIISHPSHPTAADVNEKSFQMPLCAGQETSDDWRGGGRTATEVLPLVQTPTAAFSCFSIQPCRVTLRCTIACLWTTQVSNVYLTDIHNICSSTNMFAKLIGFIFHEQIHCHETQNEDCRGSK